MVMPRHSMEGTRVIVAVLVPGPHAAHGMAELLAALGREPDVDLRVVALGQPTAAALPGGLDVTVYPVREGTLLPHPFLAPLLEHLGAEALLAPLGAVDSAPVPTLLLDLEAEGNGAELPPVPRDPAHQGWTGVVTHRPERRRLLIREGLFAVHLLPEWFRGPGRPAAAAAAPLVRHLRELLPLGGPVVPPPGTPHPLEEEVTTPLEPPPPPAAAPAVEPEEERMPTEAIPAESAVEVRTPKPPAWEPETHDPERYRDRDDGREALVLATPSGLDSLGPADLAGPLVIATPAALGWLIARMGLAHYTCAAVEPAAVEARGALAGVRTVFVHASHLDGKRLAPAARALVPLLDLGRAGGPALGWSDEMGTGFFPGPGDAALAIQWAAWLGAGVIRVVGAGPLEENPSWPAFLAGARQILEARGRRLVLDGAPDGARFGIDAGSGAGGLRATLGR